MGLKILWVTIERRQRVGFNIFIPLQKEMSKICDIDFHIKDVGVRPAAYQRQILKNPSSYKKELNPKFINNNYDLVIVDAFFAFIEEDWKKITIPKYVLIEDQHNDCRNLTRKCDSLFDFFLVRYRDAFYKNHPEISKDRIFWLPHSINTEIYYNYGETKKINYLMVGHINEKIYPLRNKIHQQLNSVKGYKRIKRPAEGKDGYPRGNDYAKLINSSWVTFTCSSIFGYPVLKFFEIPACYSALCSDYNNELKDLGFIPDENMLVYKEGMKFDKEHLNYIIPRGFNLVHTKHTAQVRAKELKEFLS